MLTSFSALAARYKVIFFDAYGVLKNSSGILPGVPDVLMWLKQTGKDIYVLTNDASRSPTEMRRGYVHPQAGELIAESRIISSGLLAKDFLRAKVRSGNVAYLGKPASSFYVKSAGLNPIPMLDCTLEDDPQAIALLDDEGYDWFEALNRTLNLIRASNIPVVIANSDLSYPVRQGEVAIAVGGLAMMIERIVGKTFIHCGKPDTMMFSYAFACAHANNDELSKQDVLMVGDTLHTDIFGANTFGIDTALVLSGNTAPEQALTLIAASGIQPTFVCESINS
jgi:HAD superfamily hydrolase (TIGR01450 family)